MTKQNETEPVSKIIVIQICCSFLPLLFVLILIFIFNQKSEKRNSTEKKLKLKKSQKQINPVFSLSIFAFVSASIGPRIKFQLIKF